MTAQELAQRLLSKPITPDRILKLRAAADRCKVSYDAVLLALPEQIRKEVQPDAE